MDTVVLQRGYLKTSKMYLSIVGIWPDQKKSNQYFMRTVVYVVMTSCILSQIAHVVCFFNVDTLMDQLFILLTSSLALTKHGIHTAKGSEFKVLLDGMIKDLETVKTKEELAVMMPYINRAVFMTTAYAYTAICSVLIILQAPLLPLIADIVIPLNESRPRGYTFPVYYYFFDMDNCYYWATLHINIAIIVIACGSIACDTFYISAVQHACGLFAIAGYRFRVAIEDITDARKIAEASNKTYRKVCRSIMAHDRAIRHVREIDNFYYGLLFIAVGVTVIGFSCTLFWLSKLTVSEQFYVHAVCLIIELAHILFLTIQGQFVINRTNSFHDEVYEGQWYNSVPKTQALFILALKAATDPPQITAGGVITMNLQTFAEIVKLSFSYYTVLQTV